MFWWEILIVDFLTNRQVGFNIKMCEIIAELMGKLQRYIEAVAWVETKGTH